MTVPAVHFQGLPEYIAGLRNAERNIKRAIGKANKRAALFVLPRVQDRHGRAYPRKGRQRKAIRARASQRRAAIAVLLNRYPEFYGDEFGSNRFRQFPPHAGKRGYFLHPTLRDDTNQIAKFYGDAYAEELRQAFPLVVRGIGR